MIHRDPHSNCMQSKFPSINVPSRVYFPSSHFSLFSKRREVQKRNRPCAGVGWLLKAALMPYEN
jgi:hypothetical protein